MADLDLLHTENMTLVAYLNMSRFRHVQMVVRPDGHVLWSYAVTPDLKSALELFNARRASVEPVMFHRAITKVRREMNDLLGR